MEKATQSPMDYDLMGKAIRPPMECDLMKKATQPPMGYDPVQAQSFDEMLADLVDQEEKRLQVNSEEFNRRHRELMQLIDSACLKE